VTARKKQSGAEILVEGMIREGVDTLFAYPGGASMPIHQALTRVKDKIRVVLPRHEQGGIFAAEGYARTTGKVGVAMTTSGPGATNLVTGLADAKMDSVPIVAITGQAATAVIGTDAFQETPIVEVARAITKAQYLVTNKRDLTRVIREAFYIARTGRPGPVLIDMPKDVQLAGSVADYDAPMELPGYGPGRKATSREIERVLRVIERAERPIIYAGGGVVSSGASSHLLRFAEKTRIPVTMTLMGLGAFPGSHELSLGMLGMHGTIYANYAINECDLLLALGVRFDDRVTGKLEEFCPRATVVHVDIDPSEINKNRPASVPIVSDVCHVLAKLADQAEARQWPEWQARIDEWKRTEPMQYKQTDDAILPQYVIEQVCELTGDDTIICTGVGQHQIWTSQFYTFNQPRTFISSGGLAAMGFGLPAAVGAQVAHPDKLVVDIDGDGSFLMNVQELATVRVEKLPLKVVIMNNQHLGMVVQWEDRFFEGRRGHTYIGCPDIDDHYPDFVAIAAGFDVPGRRVRHKSELADAMQKMLSSEGPFVLDVAVPHQEHVLPMIPAGQGVSEMIKS